MTKQNWKICSSPKFWHLYDRLFWVPCSVTLIQFYLGRYVIEWFTGFTRKINFPFACLVEIWCKQEKEVVHDAYFVGLCKICNCPPMHTVRCHNNLRGILIGHVVYDHHFTFLCAQGLVLSIYHASRLFIRPFFNCTKYLVPNYVCLGVQHAFPLLKSFNEVVLALLWSVYWYSRGLSALKGGPVYILQLQEKGEKM